LITNGLTGVAATGSDAVTQIGLLCTEYIVFAVPAGSQLSTAGDLIDLLPTPERPDVSLATARGNVNHIALAYLCRHVGAEPQAMNVRVFDSARHAIADVLERDRGVVAVSAASVLPEIGAGTLDVLAVSAPTRLGAPFAAVPTWSELGVDCTIGTWRGVIGPPGLAPATLAFWDEATRAAAQGAVWHTALSRHMWSDTYLDATATNRFMDEEQDRMRVALGELDLLGG
jgi:putative tricarboxylic transport membrane protein